MEAFATTAQYVARYGDVGDYDVLYECLSDASAAIRAACARGGVDLSDPGEELSDLLMRVCRSVANRIMPEEGDPAMQGVTQMSTTAGPYSQQYTFAASYGTPKLLPSELAMLGIGGGRVGWARLGGRDD